jgi:hypothetical protein
MNNQISNKHLNWLLLFTNKKKEIEKMRRKNRKEDLKEDWEEDWEEKDWFFSPFVLRCMRLFI